MPAWCVLLLLTSLFSPGFLVRLASAARSSVLAAFIGIVALGQTFVIIGGGIDLSVPWVLNCAAILMTLIAGGQDAAAPLGDAADPRRRRRRRRDQRRRRRALRRAADHHDARRQRHPAGQLILVYTGGSPPPPPRSVIQFLAVGRIGSGPGDRDHLDRARHRRLDRWSTATAFGRHLYAVGTSPTVASSPACRSPGPRSSPTRSPASPRRSPACCSPATPRQAYLGMGDPYLFTSIAAVAIGGASILGGSGHYIGTIAGAFVLTILTGLLPALNLSTAARCSSSTAPSSSSPCRWRRHRFGRLLARRRSS